MPHFEGLPLPSSHTFLAKSEGVNPPLCSYIIRNVWSTPPAPEPVGVGGPSAYNSIYLDYFPAWASHVARFFLETKLLKIIPYVGNVSEYFSRTMFDYGGLFLKYFKGVWTVGGIVWDVIYITKGSSRRATLSFALRSKREGGQPRLCNSSRAGRAVFSEKIRPIASNMHFLGVAIFLGYFKLVWCL